MQDSKPHKIEDVKNRLYDRRDTISGRRHEGILHIVNHKANANWSHDDIPKEKIESPEEIMAHHKSSFFKKFFIGACIFFVCALGFAGYTYWKGNSIIVSNDNINIEITGSTFVEGGQELPLQIDVTNKNNAQLELVNMSVEYPRGQVSNSTEMTRLPRIEVGQLAAGEHKTFNIKALLYGEEKSVKDILVTLEYKPINSNAIFSKKVVYPVTISSAPLLLTVDAPTEVNSNQDIALDIKASLQTKLPDGNTLLQAEYPQGFVFESAIPKPSFGNFTWNLDSISKEKPFTVSIKGKMVGQDNDEQVFRFSLGNKEVGSNSTSIDTVYNVLMHSVAIVKPFLETKILVNGVDADSYASEPNTPIKGQISWVNNLPVKISDAKIVLNLSGTAFDRSAVDGNNGFYDSKNNSIVWTKENDNALSVIEPGQKGVVDFTVTPIATGFGKFLASPEINFDVSLSGRKPDSGTTFSDVKNIIKKVVKINTDFQITSSATYVTGYLPPKVEEETKYKVTWTLSNTTNKLDKAKAVAVLPTYVSFVGGVTPITENVTYNSVSREVTWNIGQVLDQTGFRSNREASFVIALSPSLSQVNSTPILMKEINLVGTDLFTNSTIKDKYGTINTLLINDPKFQYGNEKVIQ